MRMHRFRNFLCLIGWHQHSNIRPDPTDPQRVRFDCYQSDRCRGKFHTLPADSFDPANW